jgi:hypothetical protein
MDGSRSAPGGRRSLIVVLVLALLAAVAVASTGSTAGGSGTARRPSEWLLDVVVSLLLVAMALGTVLLVLLVLLRPVLLVHDDVGAVRRRGNTLMTLVSLGLLFLLLGLAIRRLAESDGRSGLPQLLPGGDGDQAAQPGGRYEPEFQAVPVAVTLALVAVAAAAAAIASRARSRSLAPLSPDLSAAVAEVIDDTLDDLRAERDPRRAVIAAYARLEGVLAAYGAPRHVSEAPEEYLRRVLVDLDVPRHASSRLTALFARAKFSQHEVVTEMKEDAIEALETVRSELRDARERAEAAEAHARISAAERHS